MTDEAFVLADDVRVRLDGDRVNNSIELAFHYFVLGPVTTEVQAAHQRLTGRVSGEIDDADNAPPLERFFDQDGPAFRLRDDLFFSPTPSLFCDPLAVVFEWRTGSKRIRLPLDEHRLAVLGELLPRLRRHLPAQQVEAEASPSARTLLHALEAQGAVVRVPLAAVHVPKRFAVRLVGHACLLFESPDARVVVDPLLTVRQRQDLPLPQLFEGAVDAVVVTHPHWDHFNLDSLLHFDRDTTMVVPRLTSPPSIVNIDMAAVLREMGFRRVVPVVPWERVEVGDMALTALPFHGEPAAFAPQDRMTLHVALGGRHVAALADGCQDRFGRMDDVLVEVVDRLGAVDLLFAPASGFHYPVDRLTSRPFFIGPGIEQYTGGPEDVVRWATIAGARAVVPYSMFHFTVADLDGDDAAMRQDVLRRGSIRRVQELLSAWPDGPLLVLAPGQQVNWTIAAPAWT